MVMLAGMLAKEQQIQRSVAEWSLLVNARDCTLRAAATALPHPGQGHGSWIHAAAAAL